MRLLFHLIIASMAVSFANQKKKGNRKTKKKCRIRNYINLKNTSWNKGKNNYIISERFWSAELQIINKFS